MAWLEIKIDTLPQSIDAVTTALTAGGYEDLVIEDQQEFENFLDQNRAYWDYIDEELQEKLQRLMESNACYSLRQLQVNGKDMAALGLKGPRIGETLNGLLLQVVRGELENEKAALLKRAAELAG